MAFDQNSIPLDLRPLNIARTVVDESRVTPVTTTSGRNIDGLYITPSRDSANPGPYPVYYSDAGFVGLGYGNAAVPGVAGWVQRMPPSVVAPPPAVNSPAGYYYNPNMGNRVSSNCSDQASDEGADDSVSGKKVKLMCSFGGKILPRLSDGALRYVGGQTRIISVRRELSFNELVQKMADSYGQNVVIKYQLPEEDLDALVSVSCSDDLENMMDEYEKLIERSMDGSAKLRVFLFSDSELDSSGVVQMGDFEDGGQRYVEAVNGIADGAGGGIMRRESILSAASTQNSDLSGTEATDGTGRGQVDVTGLPSTGVSPKNNSDTSQESTPRLVCVTRNPAIYAEASGAPLGIQVVRSHPPTTLSVQPVAVVQPRSQQQMCFDMQQQQQIGFPQPAPYLQAYVDPQQEALNRTDYVQYSSQMGFPTQLLGTVGPMFTQQQYRDNAVNVSPHQFIPAVPMTMTPSSHASIKPNAVQPIVQPQHVQLDRYPGENTYRQLVVQLPGDQSYNAYQAQVSPAAQGGYGWHQAPHQEQVAFSEGWVPHQKVIFHEKLTRFEECYMCQKALPHAHSDTVAQTQKGSPTSTTGDLNSVYHSLRLEDNIRGQPINRPVVIGPMGEDFVEKQTGAKPRVLDHMDHEAVKPQYGGAVVSQNVDRQFENDRNILQREDNHDHPLALVSQAAVGLSGSSQSPCSAIVVPQLYQENVVQKPVVPTQYQVKQNALMNKALNVDSASVGDTSSSQTSDQLHDSPQAYSGNLPGFIPKEGVLEPSLAYDQLRQIGARMEKLSVLPSEVFLNNEQGTSLVGNSKKEDISEHRAQYIAEKELYVDNAFSKPKMIFDANRYKQNEMLLCPSNEVPYSQNLQPMDSREVTQQPLLVNPGYPRQRTAINLLAPNETSYGKPITFSGVDSAQVPEKIPQIVDWKNNPLQFQSNMAYSDLEAHHLEENILSSLSPLNRVGDMQDNSNSLFSSEDPWNLRHDTHFPPPRPNKFLTRKEVYGIIDPFGDNRLGNSGESPFGNIGVLVTELRPDNGAYQPSGNLDTGHTVRSNKEEYIKQELQAVAEGVASSVLIPYMPSNADSFRRSGSSSEANQETSEANQDTSEANQDTEVQNSDVQVQHTDKSEFLKLPERVNLGFPVSDGIGRLQIIKNIDLEELQELGSGTFGTVYHGKWRGSDVAIKRINDRCFAGKPSEQERMRADFWNEAIKLADLHHPNVVAFYGIVLDGPGGSMATVTEYMVNGSLRTALQMNEKNLDKRKRLLIAMDVAFGMEYLHGKNIVHFDLKSDNLLVNLRDPHRPICKVGDLGLSKAKCQTLISGGVRGTLPWMAPELLNGISSLVSEKVDVFSFGIVLWELLTGDEPYADLHYGAIIGGIVSNSLRPQIPEYCHPEWRSLMERCWSTEPSERPNFTEIANQLRAMAVKVPPKVQAQQQPPSIQPQVKN